MKPKVSVCMITYNHEKYIAQAIESVLMQKTNFNYELVIGEDFSTDKTREIVVKYQKKYPNKIKLILNKKNFEAQPNFIQTLKACKGEYIALLEGDDYWTSPHKLQRQTDFLDKNDDFMICFNKTLSIYEDNSKASHIFPKKLSKKSFTIIDLLKENFMATCSGMVKNIIDIKYPNWFFNSFLGDYPFFIMHAKYGKIGYIDEFMSVYRIHKDGIWSMKMEDDLLENLNNGIKLYKNINKYLDYKYDKLIKERIYELNITLKQKYIKLKDIKNINRVNFYLNKNYNFWFYLLRKIKNLRTYLINIFKKFQNKGFYYLYWRKT